MDHIGSITLYNLDNGKWVEDPDEMPLYMAFHPGLHCLLRVRQNDLQRKKFNCIWELQPVTPQYISGCLVKSALIFQSKHMLWVLKTLV